MDPLITQTIITPPESDLKNQPEIILSAPTIPEKPKKSWKKLILLAIVFILLIPFFPIPTFANNKLELNPLVFQLFGVSISGLGKDNWENDAFYREIPTPTEAVNEPSPSTTLNWKTYTNTAYNFSINYPAEFKLEEEPKTEKFYDKIAKLSSSSKELTIKVIHDIDVYKNLSPKNVVSREIMDSGLDYKIEEVKVNGLQSALVETTNTYNVPTEAGFPANGLIATIAHPTLNLFAEISINSKDKLLFDQILSTFKFIPPKQTLQGEITKQYGIIKNVYQKDVKKYLDIDYVDYLSGIDAIKASIEDGVCKVDNSSQAIEELSKLKNNYCGNYCGCAPNGFYIRNNNPKLRTFEITDDVEIIMNTYQGPNLCEHAANESLEYQRFEKYYTDGCGDQFTPFIISIQNDKVMKIEEIYLP